LRNKKANFQIKPSDLGEGKKGSVEEEVCSVRGSADFHIN